VRIEVLGVRQRAEVWSERRLSGPNPLGDIGLYDLVRRVPVFPAGQKRQVGDRNFND
jgi:hypothetical protein